MKISAQEEYGLRCLVQLASVTNGETLTLPQIAELEGISQSNAGKLMWLLNKSGFVKATRGTKGGYSLARPADEIYLSEVIKVLDDDEIEGHCGSYTGVLDSCVHTGDCGIRSVIVGLHEIVQNALSNVTLSQLVGTEKKVDERFHRIQRMAQ
ncbi:MAG: Rrf2 family transcriptional regulator [Acidobacteria bacterium]|nr:MAG: Rrf2 family transcriptional regulator [Acidobacteriota bacterium]REJ98870.1 MAG: Rrf2 family transcriptional regulator [Acidobacteriota bacterium]REK16410.1 MAG: Rrf2 family transcriptional regulator [Acidobacteriota bacterium]REK44091.1 MAG: Rrf2 family transcriptional regulator [Acidobacteriota bacterium]